MKKTLKVLLVLTICALICCGSCFIYAGMVIHKKTGWADDMNHIAYVLDENISKKGVLTFNREDYKYGEDTSCGVMNNYSALDDYSDAPWQKYDNVTRVTIESVSLAYGINTIGENAFRGQDGIKTLSIPSTLTTIKKGAFENCSGITAIKYFGTAEQWNSLTVESNNDGIFSKTFEELVASGVMYTPEKGDVNIDGTVNNADAVALARCITGYSDAYLSVADVNEDGKINVSDCVKIKLMIG